MNTLIRKAIVGSVATLAAGTALGGTAFATSGSVTLSGIKARASIAIDARLGALHFAISDVNTNRVITASDKTTLLTTLDGDVSGLTALDSKIQADTTVAEAAADYKTIFTGYRVFALALPQVRYAAAVDDITGGVLPRLTDADSRLSALLAGLDKSKDTPAVQAAMSDLASQIQAIRSSTSGLSAEVLAFTPAEYDANHALLSGPVQTLRTARADVRSARHDVAFVVEEIK